MAASDFAIRARPVTGEHLDQALPEGVLKLDVLASRLNGVDVVHCDVLCSGRVVYPCRGAQGLRLTILLEEVGGHIVPRQRVSAPSSAVPLAHAISLFPVEEPLFGYSNKLSAFRKLALLFELDKLREHMSDQITRAATLDPISFVGDADVWHLGRMLAAQCRGIQPANQLYSETLVTAIVARLAALQGSGLAPRRGGLTPNQLRKVTDYIEAHVADNIALGTLAKLAGLSQSQFAYAFKSSTGSPPHRWQLAARVRRAQVLLLDTRVPVAQVAAETGFADQAHLTRVFGRVVGATPAVWRRERTR